MEVSRSRFYDLSIVVHYVIETKRKGEAMKKYYTIALEQWVNGERSKIIAETKPMTKTEFIVRASQLRKNFQPLTTKSFFEERTYGYAYNANTNEKVKEKRLQ